MLCCAVLCCAVPCCAVLCCAVLCCAVLCCAVVLCPVGEFATTWLCVCARVYVLCVRVCVRFNARSMLLLLCCSSVARVLSAHPRALAPCHAMWRSLVLCADGTGVSFGYVCPIAAAARWFPDKVGFINGLAVAGFGAGAFIFNFVIKWVANPDGLDTSGDRTDLAVWTPVRQALFAKSMEDNMPTTFIVLGIIYTLLVGLGALTMRLPEGGYYRPALKRALSRSRSMSASSTAKKAKKASEVREFTRDEMLRTQHFWMLWASFILSASSGLMVRLSWGSGRLCACLCEFLLLRRSLLGSKPRGACVFVCLCVCVCLCLCVCVCVCLARLSVCLVHSAPSMWTRLMAVGACRQTLLH